jgi:hypothetical protein
MGGVETVDCVARGYGVFESLLRRRVHYAEL